MWEILKANGVDPAPHRTTVTWADFLRSQAETILAMDFIETVTLTGQRQYILAAIHHAGRRAHILGTTAHPTHARVTQTVRNLLMDLEDAGSLARVRFLIRDRDGKYPGLIDEILASAGITTVLTGARMPRMNSIMERVSEDAACETAGPHTDLERVPPPADTARVRAALQPAPNPPITRRRSTPENPAPTP
ncbi:hypothetical protein [Kibdelosporangium aridum]|uniref:hypothetical protein n=1 Tax=Kibdelosporangium aridum TaxID=2030 RepID=UPI000A79A1D3